ncbi:MAG: hypothetical protein E7062_05835, partial [Spirochaetaceae bacterium]|nr:hypothetical protein [Spirochaetaceae bacterium]
MTTGKKIVFSLLITIISFSIFFVTALAGLFSFLETQFYQPNLTKSIEDNLIKISDNFEIYAQKYRTIFENFTLNASVKKSFLSAPSQEDIENRAKISGELLANHSGLEGIRIVDSAGKRIHYSTFKTDILKQTDKALSYKHYTQVEHFPYEKNHCVVSDTYKIVFDEELQRILFSFPFFDNYDMHKGTVIFYLAGYDFQRFLISEKLLNFRDKIYLVGISPQDISQENYGFVLGLPYSGYEILLPKIKSLWSNQKDGFDVIAETENDSWVAISKTSQNFVPVSWILKEGLFVFSDAVKLVLLICVFITMYLVINTQI